MLTIFDKGSFLKNTGEIGATCKRNYVSDDNDGDHVIYGDNDGDQV